MTEKRFSWDNVNIAIKDNQNRKKYFIDVTCIDEIVDLLNELHEEKQQLKKENENLKQTIETQIFNYNNAKSIIHSSEKQIWRLEDDNEELKDEVYNELDNALTVLTELYEVIPISSQSKMNRLYNRLKSLRDDIK